MRERKLRSRVMRARILRGTFGVVIFCGVLFLMMDVLRVKSQTRAGTLMSAACEDIKAHETLRVEYDFDQIITTISSHIHSYRDQGDTLVARAVKNLRNLKEEAVFHNNDLNLYHKQFALILNQLTYVELEDAISLAEEGEIEMAQTAIKHAQHYLHDALTFTKNPDFTLQMELLHEVNRLSGSSPNPDIIKRSLEKVKKVI